MGPRCRESVQRRCPYCNESARCLDFTFHISGRPHFGLSTFQAVHISGRAIHISGRAIHISGRPHFRPGHPHFGPSTFQAGPSTFRAVHISGRAIHISGRPHFGSSTFQAGPSTFRAVHILGRAVHISGRPHFGLSTFWAVHISGGSHSRPPTFQAVHISGCPHFRLELVRTSCMYVCFTGAAVELVASFSSSAQFNGHATTFECSGTESLLSQCPTGSTCSHGSLATVSCQSKCKALLDCR